MPITVEEKCFCYFSISCGSPLHAHFGVRSPLILIPNSFCIYCLTISIFSQLWQATQKHPALNVVELKIVPNEIASKSGMYTTTHNS